MNRKFKINCKDVFDASNKYQEIRDEFESIQKELSSIKDEILLSWRGVDSHNFGVNFDLYIDSYYSAIDFMDYNYNLLKNNSSAHSKVDEEFDEKVKRKKDIYE